MNEALVRIELVKLVIQGGSLAVLLYVLYRVFNLADLFVKRVEIRKDHPPPDQKKPRSEKNP